MTDHGLIRTVSIFARDHVELLKGSHLWLTVVSDENDTNKAPAVDVASFKTSNYKPDDPHKSGTLFEGEVKLPTNLNPGKAEKADLSLVLAWWTVAQILVEVHVAAFVR